MTRGDLDQLGVESQERADVAWARGPDWSLRALAYDTLIAVLDSWS
jgi:hypothetical protein